MTFLNSKHVEVTRQMIATNFNLLNQILYNNHKFLLGRNGHSDSDIQFLSTFFAQLQLHHYNPYRQDATACITTAPVTHKLSSFIIATTYRFCIKTSNADSFQVCHC